MTINSPGPLIDDEDESTGQTISIEGNFYVSTNPDNLIFAVLPNFDEEGNFLEDECTICHRDLGSIVVIGNVDIYGNSLIESKEATNKGAINGFGVGRKD